MAVAVPALTGYIDKARNDSAVVQASSAKTALQTIVSSAKLTNSAAGVDTYKYTLNDGKSYVELKITASTGVVAPTAAADDVVSLATAVKDLTGVTLTEVKDVKVGTTVGNTRSITDIVVLTTDKHTATYAGNEWTVKATS
jgi:type II secretory pathway pseudopilin PulG